MAYDNMGRQEGWTDADTVALEARLAAAKSRLERPDVQQPAMMSDATWLKATKAGGKLFCSQCKRPYSLQSIYRVGRLYLCVSCWADMVTEYHIAFGPVALEEGPRELGWREG